MSAETRIRTRPLLDEARLSLGESVHSATLIGSNVLVLDGRRSPRNKDIGLRTGMTAPAHSMAAGKLLLAALDDSQIVALFPVEPFARRGPETITTRQELFSELQAIRSQGWAESREESESGVHSVAIPLDGETWRTRMALVMSLPRERAEKEALQDLAIAAITLVKQYSDQRTVSPWSFTSRSSTRSHTLSPTLKSR
ncbi:IclR family transcriptional regulator domain-containing protein [Leucobacter sp. W1038]|uniref:IclR family transcriptional regulator domain-containing protein n=1 Tax=Leucobacter sp. W1038 TaxID=3438281 RepID=UPI003D99CEF9